jgi:hypothetical protein
MVLQKFAEVGGRLERADVERILGWDLERRAGGVEVEIGTAGELGPDLARDYGHALGGVGAEVELARVENADGVASPLALETDALNLSFEVHVVLEHDEESIA